MCAYVFTLHVCKSVYWACEDVRCRVCGFAHVCLRVTWLLTYSFLSFIFTISEFIQMHTYPSMYILECVCIDVFNLLRTRLLTSITFSQSFRTWICCNFQKQTPITAQAIMCGLWYVPLPARTHTQLSGAKDQATTTIWLFCYQQTNYKAIQ